MSFCVLQPNPCYDVQPNEEVHAIIFLLTVDLHGLTGAQGLKFGLSGSMGRPCESLSPADTGTHITLEEYQQTELHRGTLHPLAQSEDHC